MISMDWKMKTEKFQGLEREARCVNCGCAGNTDCGHLPPPSALSSGRGCALNARLVCPCCVGKTDGTDRTDKKEKYECEN
jgi:hypothetical protein